MTRGGGMDDPGASACDPHSGPVELPVTVVLGQFDPVVACGLTAILSGYGCLQVLESDVRSSSLLQVLAAKQPHVAILNGPSDHTSLTELRAAQQHCPLLILVDRQPRAYIALLAAVGLACVTYRSTPSAIRAAVHQAASTREGGARSAASLMPMHHALTKREHEVLVRLLAGASQAETAAYLDISPQTVKTYARALRRKLGVAPKTRLVHAVLAAGEVARPGVTFPATGDC